MEAGPAEVVLDLYVKLNTLDVISAFGLHPCKNQSKKFSVKFYNHENINGFSKKQKCFAEKEK